MPKDIIDWLIEANNPAIEYRTKTELLHEKADNSKAIDWVKNILPVDWKSTKGLWLTYYYTAIAECGINGIEFGIKKDEILNLLKNHTFENGCGDFMLLRALVMLGFERELQDLGIMEQLNKKLPDGGFLCLHRLNKLKNPPKSCIKSNNLALLFISECKKRNIKTLIEDDLVQYYWKHNIFYKSTDLSTLMLNAKDGWRTIDTFYPFEVMRVGIQNIVEAFFALGYGNDKKTNGAIEILETKKDKDGRYILDGTLTKSYLPKERIGKPSKWVTFYALSGEKYRKIKQKNNA